MKSTMSSLIAILFTLGLTSAALAQEGAADKSLPIPLTMKDLSGKSKVELSLAMLPGTEDGADYFGMAPMVSFQFAVGDLSLGLAVPMAAYFPKGNTGGDDSFVLGNPTIDVLYRRCTRGEWSLCLGGGLGIGVGLVDVDNLEELSAHLIGMAGHEDWRYHYPESLAISPTLVAGVTNGILVGQAELGTTVIVPIKNTTNRDTEAGLSFAFGGGVTLMNVLVPLIEFRGFVPFKENTFLITRGNDPFLWLSFGARLQLGNFSPMFRLSVPFNDQSKLAAPVQLEAGFAYQF